MVVGGWIPGMLTAAARVEMMPECCLMSVISPDVDVCAFTLMSVGSGITADLTHIFEKVEKQKKIDLLKFINQNDPLKDALHYVAGIQHMCCEETLPTLPSGHVEQTL